MAKPGAPPPFAPRRGRALLPISHSSHIRIHKLGAAPQVLSGHKLLSYSEAGGRVSLLVEDPSGQVGV